MTKYVWLNLLWLIYIPSLSAAPAVALGSTPKYSPNFTHFDYVNPDAPKGGKITFYESGSFDSLNPYVLKGIAVTGTHLVFEHLMTESQDEPFTAYGLLAEDIALSEDQLSVTFKLNPAAKFSNGKAVTADDVKVSFDVLMSDKAHPQYRIYWADIKYCEVIDPLTVRFDFKQVNRELFMIVGQVPIFSRDWIGDQPFDKLTHTTPIGSGPYTLDRYDLGKTARYKRNPDYWAKDLNVRKGHFNFDTIDYQYYKDMTIALEALKAGEFDLMDIYSAKQWVRDLSGASFEKKPIKKLRLPHKNNAGMQGFVMNIRKPLFQDKRVRQALNLAFDFEWLNKHLFFEQYDRCDSYFSNTELASSGLPQGDELALLEPFRSQLPASVFDKVWQPISTKGKGGLRQNLRAAKKLLKQAGWQFDKTDQVLKNKQGHAFEFEVILVQKSFERILAPFERNLKKLGMKVSYRTVDPALYKRRRDTFDYDMLVASFAQSLSPGNEQLDMWHSRSVDQKGSQNLIGLKDPVVDALLEQLVVAKDRKQLTTILHALDRVLLHGDYIIPQWFIGVHRVAYWDKFAQPKIDPLYYGSARTRAMSGWWVK